MNETQHGYMVIADISGYTSFVAKTELEHSQEILTELLELLMEKFQPLMTISKLEGDAVFAYAPEAMFARGETLIEFIEAMYVSFRDRQVSMKRETTCTCNACRNISTLDLKFFAHHGDYYVQHVKTIRELVGSDVNLIHRLTKNHLSEQTSWRAYAMFTEQSLKHLNIQLEGLHQGVENYEHLGDIRVLSMDMRAHYKGLMDTRHVVVTPEEAHHVFEYDYNAPPSIVWEWFNDPHKRSQWMTNEIVPILRVGGRSGVVGARNHCVHGKNQIIVEDILDMHPCDYFTISHAPPGFPTALRMDISFSTND